VFHGKARLVVAEQTGSEHDLCLLDACKDGHVPEPPLSIAGDGDDWEKLYWEAFASERFPSYEDFWLAHVVPLTNRATDRLSSDLRIRFRTDAELAADGRGHEDVAIAQLHYTLLLHVGRVWQLLDQAHAFTSGDAGWAAFFDQNCLLRELHATERSKRRGRRDA
jgi:hypothetical protein